VHPEGPIDVGEHPTGVVGDADGHILQRSMGKRVQHGARDKPGLGRQVLNGDNGNKEYGNTLDYTDL